MNPHPGHIKATPPKHITDRLLRLMEGNPGNEARLLELVCWTLVADGRVHPRERLWVEDLLARSAAAPHAPDLRSRILDPVRVQDPGPLHLERAWALETLQILVDVSYLDFDLHFDELRYVRRAGAAMGLGGADTRAVMERNAPLFRAGLLKILRESLDEDGKDWFARVGLAVIYADEAVEDSELAYMDDFLWLLDGDDFRLDSLDPDMEDLPTLATTPRLARVMLTYLLLLSMVDDDFHEAERRVIVEAAEKMSLAAEEVAALIDTVRAIFIDK